MRVMIKASIPVEAGNKAITGGGLARTMMAFVEKFKPEACYFTPENGRRTALFFVDMKDPTDLPSMVEPFFVELNAAVEVSPAMNLADMKAGVERAMAGK